MGEVFTPPDWLVCLLTASTEPTELTGAKNDPDPERKPLQTKGHEPPAPVSNPQLTGHRQVLTGEGSPSASEPDGLLAVPDFIGERRAPKPGWHPAAPVSSPGGSSGRLPRPTATTELTGAATNRQVGDAVCKSVREGENPDFMREIPAPTAELPPEHGGSSVSTRQHLSVRHNRQVSESKNHYFIRESSASYPIITPPVSSVSPFPQTHKYTHPDLAARATLERARAAGARFEVREKPSPSVWLQPQPSGTPAELTEHLSRHWTGICRLVLAEQGGGEHEPDARSHPTRPCRFLQ